jgi:hypothetical protein
MTKVVKSTQIWKRLVMKKVSKLRKPSVRLSAIPKLARGTQMVEVVRRFLNYKKSTSKITPSQRIRSDVRFDK